MSTKNQNKAVNANVKESAKKEILSTLNLDKLAEKIASSGGISKTKQALYKYPEFTDESKKVKFAENSDVINGLIGKNWRNKKRAELQRFARSIILSYVKKDINGCKNTIKAFKNHYVEFYSINDFSINSLSQKKDVEEIKGMLDVILVLEKK